MAAISNNTTPQAELAYVRAMLNRHYPLIAGHAMRLKADGEEAASAWLDLARDIADAIVGLGR